jgi:hypothetical protein
MRSCLGASKPERPQLHAYDKLREPDSLNRRFALSEDSETTPPNDTKGGITYAENSGAPFIYFDGVACHGALNAVVEIELAARIMAPIADGGVEMKFVPAGRLRCSRVAAASLIDSLQKVLKMPEQPEQGPATASQLN